MGNVCSSCDEDKILEAFRLCDYLKEAMDPAVRGVEEPGDVDLKRGLLERKAESMNRGLAPESEVEILNRVLLESEEERVREAYELFQIQKYILEEGIEEEEFWSKLESSTVNFNYSLNKGKYKIGKDDRVFSFSFNPANASCVYFYRDDLKSIGKLKSGKKMEEIRAKDAGKCLDNNESHILELSVGDIVCMRNSNDRYASLQLTKFKYVRTTVEREKMSEWGLQFKYRVDL